MLFRWKLVTLSLSMRTNVSLNAPDSMLRSMCSSVMRLPSACFSQQTHSHLSQDDAEKV